MEIIFLCNTNIFGKGSYSIFMNYHTGLTPPPLTIHRCCDISYSFLKCIFTLDFLSLLLLSVNHIEISHLYIDK